MNSEQQARYSAGNFLRMLRDQAWLIVGVTAVFGLAALAYSLHQSKTYEATATLNVQDPASLTGTATTTLTAGQLAAQEAARVSRLAVARHVKTVLQSPLSPAQLRGTISTRVDPVSNVVDV